jgi:protein O-GlcNAc transferase
LQASPTRSLGFRIRPFPEQPSLNSNLLSPETAKERALEHLNAGRLQQAEQLFLSLLDKAPDDPELRYHCALAQIRHARGEAALEHTRQLLARHPDWLGSHAIHGEALLSLGDYEGALREFDWIVAREARDPLANLKRGFALAALGEFAQAQAAFESARAADGAFVARFCRELSPDPDAPAELDPQNIFLWRRYLAQGDCDWRDWDRYIARFRRAIADPAARLERGLVYASLHLPLDVSERQSLARRVATDIEERVAALPPRVVSAARQPLRIGILSPNLRMHVDALLLLPLFELLDRGRFEVYAYSLCPDDRSGIRGRIQRAAHRFRDLSALGSTEAVQQIRRDEIDILIDAAGLSDGTRFEIVAARPAPLQVLYLGFASTLGSERVDYAILDAVVAPREHLASWSEKVVCLPDTYFLYDFRTIPDARVSSRAEYGLPDNSPVLCAFHKPEKIEPETFSLWMKILRAHQSAVLWLLGEGSKVAANLRRAADGAGIAPERLIFCAREEHERYLTRLRLADLFVDAIHHNAIVTACDCLAVGLPVLTLHGSTCTSLSAESLARAAGLPELVARDRDDYVRKAVELLRNRANLDGLRAKLAHARQHAPLFDTAGRVRELEAAFSEMWRRHAAGLPPASFAVSKGGV